MKAIHAGMLTLMVSAAFVPVASGEATAECDVASASATQIAPGYYVAAARAELWQEENGYPGLQLRAYGCADGSVIPADQCLAINPFTGLNQQLMCAAAAADALLP